MSGLSAFVFVCHILVQFGSPSLATAQQTDDPSAHLSFKNIVLKTFGFDPLKGCGLFDPTCKKDDAGSCECNTIEAEAKAYYQEFPSAAQLPDDLNAIKEQLDVNTGRGRLLTDYIMRKHASKLKWLDLNKELSQSPPPLDKDSRLVLLSKKYGQAMQAMMTITVKKRQEMQAATEGCNRMSGAELAQCIVQSSESIEKRFKPMADAIVASMPPLDSIEDDLIKAADGAFTNPKAPSQPLNKVLKTVPEDLQYVMAPVDLSMLEPKQTLAMLQKATLGASQNAEKSIKEAHAFQKKLGQVFQKKNFDVGSYAHDGPDSYHYNEATAGITEDESNKWNRILIFSNPEHAQAVLKCDASVSKELACSGPDGAEDLSGAMCWIPRSMKEKDLDIVADSLHNAGKQVAGMIAASATGPIGGGIFLASALYDAGVALNGTERCVLLERSFAEENKQSGSDFARFEAALNENELDMKGALSKQQEEALQVSSCMTQAHVNLALASAGVVAAGSSLFGGAAKVIQAASTGEGSALSQAVGGLFSPNVARTLVAFEQTTATPALVTGGIVMAGGTAVSYSAYTDACAGDQSKSAQCIEAKIALATSVGFAAKGLHDYYGQTLGAHKTETHVEEVAGREGTGKVRQTKQPKNYDHPEPNTQNDQARIQEVVEKIKAEKQGSHDPVNEGLLKALADPRLAPDLADARKKYGPFTPEQEETLIRTHYEALGENGIDGKPAGLGTYTRPQTIRKYRMLRAKGKSGEPVFTEDVAKGLMEDGYCGFKWIQDLFGITQPAPTPAPAVEPRPQGQVGGAAGRYYNGAPDALPPEKRKYPVVPAPSSRAAASPQDAPAGDAIPVTRFQGQRRSNQQGAGRVEPNQGGALVGAGAAAQGAGPRLVEGTPVEFFADGRWQKGVYARMSSTSTPEHPVYGIIPDGMDKALRVNPGDLRVNQPAPQPAPAPASPPHKVYPSGPDLNGNPSFNVSRGPEGPTRLANNLMVTILPDGRIQVREASTSNGWSLDPPAMGGRRPFGNGNSLVRNADGSYHLEFTNGGRSENFPQKTAPSPVPARPANAANPLPEIIPQGAPVENRRPIVVTRDAGGGGKIQLGVSPDHYATVTPDGEIEFVDGGRSLQNGRQQPLTLAPNHDEADVWAGYKIRRNPDGSVVLTDYAGKPIFEKPITVRRTETIPQGNPVENRPPVVVTRYLPNGGGRIELSPHHYAIIHSDGAVEFADGGRTWGNGAHDTLNLFGGEQQAEVWAGYILRRNPDGSVILTDATGKPVFENPIQVAP